MSDLRRIELYTDGAVKGNGGPGRIGMAALLRWVPDWGEPPLREREYSWYQELDYATNIRAELEAIAGGLLRIRSDFWRGCDLRIVTDSLWSKRAIEETQRVNVYLDRVIVIRTTLAAFGRWEIVHVRGHAGIPGNERADRLATTAAGSVPRTRKKSLDSEGERSL